MSSPRSIHDRSIHQFDEVELQPGDLVLITREAAPGQWRYYRSVVPNGNGNGDPPVMEGVNARWTAEGRLLIRNIETNQWWEPVFVGVGEDNTMSWIPE